MTNGQRIWSVHEFIFDDKQDFKCLSKALQKLDVICKKKNYVIPVSKFFGGKSRTVSLDEQGWYEVAKGMCKLVWYAVHCIL